MYCENYSQAFVMCSFGQSIHLWFTRTYTWEVCQWLATGRWFSPGSLVSSTNKTDHHDITEILLKVALSKITLTLTYTWDTREIDCYQSRLQNHKYSFICYIAIWYMLCLWNQNIYESSIQCAKHERARIHLVQHHFSALKKKQKNRWSIKKPIR
jgi:hypothetical protein